MKAVICFMYLYLVSDRGEIILGRTILQFLLGETYLCQMFEMKSMGSRLVLYVTRDLFLSLHS